MWPALLRGIEVALQRQPIGSRRTLIGANTGQLKSLVDALTQMPFVRVVDNDSANLSTKREEDFVRLVADGLSNRDIARKLNLSEHRVKNYIFRIFERRAEIST